jgi:hypothetical protein
MQKFLETKKFFQKLLENFQQPSPTKKKIEISQPSPPRDGKIENFQPPPPRKTSAYTSSSDYSHCFPLISAHQIC